LQHGLETGPDKAASLEDGIESFEDHMDFRVDAGTEHPRMIKGTFSGAFLIPVRRRP
jgi:hypothetical protein